MAYLGKVTLTIPVGTISSDFPQNLFFHLWSVDTGQHIHLYTCERTTFYKQMLTELLPCQNVKFSDSAWQAEMGGWWHTWYTMKKGF